MEALTLKKRFFGFGLLLLAIFVGVFVSDYLINRSLETSNARYVARMAGVQHSLKADMAHDAIHADVLSFLIAARAQDAKGAEAARAALKEDIETMRSSLAKAAKSGLSTGAKAAVAKARDEAEGYFNAAQAVTAVSANDAATAEAKRPEFIKWFQTLETAMAASSQLIKTSSETLRIKDKKAAASAKVIVLGLAGAGCALLLLLSFLLARSVLKPLGGEPVYATEIVKRIAGGNLGEDIVTAAGDTDSLLANMKSMQEELARTVYRVREAVDTVGTASGQIAAGNADLSSRTEEQASSLEETASSMEELTSTVKQNAENAQQANQLVLGASGVAVKGGEVVGQVVETMGAINEASKKIVDIISVIDGIAFQTNILALNAAVEAARAGEQGRGFAVVASEVRTLAQRSAAAAKEIKALIGDSVDKVDTGTQLVDEAGKTMQEIVTSVKRVTDIMAEITAASQEQSSGIEQVNQAIAQMDEVTQQNAALVEEAAAAAESMRYQATGLAQAVAAFKLKDRDAAASREMRTEPTLQTPVRSPGERRGPNRATNVARLSAKAATKTAKPAKADAPAPVKVAAGGSKEQWEEF